MKVIFLSCLLLIGSALLFWGCSSVSGHNLGNPAQDDDSGEDISDDDEADDDDISGDDDIDDDTTIDDDMDDDTGTIPADSNWHQITGNHPENMSRQGMVYDSIRKEIVLFGGGATVPYDYTFTFSDLLWIQKYTNTHPTIRFSPMMTENPNRSVIFLFGGLGPIGSSNFLNDAWEWNGSKWSKINTTNSPSKRADAVIGYCQADEKIYLFGGCNGSNCSTQLNDTWEYDSATSIWTQLTLDPSPSPRSGAAFFYDSTENVFILFGGVTNASPLQLTNESWSFDCNAWLLLDPNNSPPAMAYAGAAYDSLKQKALIFSGFDGAQELDDTWLWDGATWTNLPTSNSPPARQETGMAFNTSEDLFVLFGGKSQENFFGDTWVLKLE